MRKPKPRPTAYQAALERLARRDHSRSELLRALQRAGHSKDDVVAALDRLAAQRALDDGRFAATYARSRLAHHGLGRRRIQAALRQRGIARDVAEAGLEAAMEELPEQDALDSVARRLLARPVRGDARKHLLRAYATLVRRGFPPALVRERLSMLRKGTGDILDGYQFEEPETSGDGESEDG